MFTGQPHDGARGRIKLTVMSVLYELKNVSNMFGQSTLFKWRLIGINRD